MNQQSDDEDTTNTTPQPAQSRNTTISTTQAVQKKITTSTKSRSNKSKKSFSSPKLTSSVPTTDHTFRSRLAIGKKMKRKDQVNPTATGTFGKKSGIYI